MRPTSTARMMDESRDRAVRRSSRGRRRSRARTLPSCSWIGCRSLLSSGDFSRNGPVMACADSSALKRVVERPLALRELGVARCPDSTASGCSAPPGLRDRPRSTFLNAAIASSNAAAGTARRPICVRARRGRAGIARRPRPQVLERLVVAAERLQRDAEEVVRLRQLRRQSSAPARASASRRRTSPSWS